MNNADPNFVSKMPESAGANFPRINKLKIVGNGQNNWSVASSGPFYLLETELGAQKGAEADLPLTGATNLIQHFGLLSAYHKFCGRPLKPQLSAFLPNIAGNVDQGAQSNAGSPSSLLSLLHKPPIQKEIVPLPSSLMSDAFRLHSDPMPNLSKFFTTQQDSDNAGMATENGVLSMTHDKSTASSKSVKFKNVKKRQSRAAALDILPALEPPISASQASGQTGGVPGSDASVTDPSMNLSKIPPQSGETTPGITHTILSASEHSGVSKSKKAKRNDDDERKKKKKKKKDKKKEKLGAMIN